MRYRATVAWIATLVLITVAASAGAMWWFAGNSLRIDPNDAQQVAAGAGIYRVHCASCHGTNLEGQADWRTRLPNGRLPAPPHDGSGHTWHHADEVLLKIVREGPAFYASLGVQTDMPAFGTILSEADMAAVLAYIKSTWPPEIRARQAHISR